MLAVSPGIDCGVKSERREGSMKTTAEAPRSWMEWRMKSVGSKEEEGRVVGVAGCESDLPSPLSPVWCKVYGGQPSTITGRSSFPPPPTLACSVDLERVR